MNIEVPELNPKKLSELKIGDMFLTDDGDVYIKIKCYLIGQVSYLLAVNLHNGETEAFDDAEVLWLENVTINGNKLRR